MDSVDEAMRKLHNNKIKGFTIFELLIVVALVGILSTIAIASHSQRWAQERLLAAVRETQTWLENQRLLAITEGQGCDISIDTDTATLDPSAETISIKEADPNGIIITLGVLNNSCSNQTPLVITDSVPNGDEISLSTSDPNATGIRFSFRGLSEIITTNGTTANENLVLKFIHPKSNKQRCIKVMSPLGFIRTGWSESNADSCQYSNTF